MWGMSEKISGIILVLAGIASFLVYYEHSHETPYATTALSMALPPEILSFFVDIAILVVLFLCVMRQRTLEKRLSRHDIHTNAKEDT